MLEENKIIRTMEIETLVDGVQRPMTIGYGKLSSLPGRIIDGEIVYDIMFVNPSVCDLVEILNASTLGRVEMYGNPLMEGQSKLGVQRDDLERVVPIGDVEWVGQAGIGAGLIQFENFQTTDEESGYKLINLKPLGAVNYIDATSKA